MSLFEKGFNLKGGLKDVFSSPKSFFKNQMDPGAVLFGGASTANSLGQRRDGTKGGLLGDKGLGIDWFGSPITAGTDSQGLARGAALVYGALMAAGAAGAGSAAGGGTTAGTAGGTAMPAAVAQSPGSVAATQGGTTTAGTASTTPAWLRYARMGNSFANGMRRPPQPAPAQPRPPMDPYGLVASGLPEDAWRDQRMQIIQALMQQPDNAG